MFELFTILKERAAHQSNSKDSIFGFNPMSVSGRPNSGSLRASRDSDKTQVALRLSRRLSPRRRQSPCSDATGARALRVTMNSLYIICATRGKLHALVFLARVPNNEGSQNVM